MRRTEIRRIINGAAYVARDARRFARGGGWVRQGRLFTNQGLVGTVDEILDIIRAYRNVGVDTFGIRFPAGQVVEQMKRFGAEVIPEAGSSFRGWPGHVADGWRYRGLKPPACEESLGVDHGAARPQATSSDEENATVRCTLRYR